MLSAIDLKSRCRAAGIHLIISALVAAVAAALVFFLWYPGYYRKLAGGQDLFLLITAVDLVLGPLLTFAVFNLKKGWPHLRRDLGIIASKSPVKFANPIYREIITRILNAGFQESINHKKCFEEPT